VWMRYSVVCSSCVGGESLPRGVLDVFDYKSVVACMYILHDNILQLGTCELC
jgi:hypothetical protein